LPRCRHCIERGVALSLAKIAIVVVTIAGVLVARGDQTLLSRRVRLVELRYDPLVKRAKGRIRCSRP